MTQNRARKLAARAAATTTGVRRPEAAYRTDHRKLRLQDGVIHDFSAGPIRLLGAPGRGSAAPVIQLLREAGAKEWDTAYYTDTMAARGLDPNDLPVQQPALIVVIETGVTGAARHRTISALDAGAYPGLNVVVVREPAPGEHRLAPSMGRNIHLDTAAPSAQMTTMTLDDLSIPASAQQFATATSGLFLVAGATGAGKTATGAAMLREVCRGTSHPAAAIMHPVEMLLAQHTGVALYPTQGGDDAASSIRQAVASGAKTIFVDGLYTPEAIEAALDAALGGALVIATLHSRASQAAQRLLDSLPNPGSAKMRTKVQTALQGVIEQVLVRSKHGRSLAAEVWTKDDNSRLTPVLTFQDSVAALVADGEVLPAYADKASARRR